jgi:hypothetical protein
LHIDPFADRQDVYARLPTMGPDELPSLLPDRWLADHPQHLIPARVQEGLDRAQRARERRAERRAAEFLTCYEAMDDGATQSEAGSDAVGTGSLAAVEFHS